MEKQDPVDRGYAWVITFAVFCNNILCVGYFLAFGVFFVEIIDVFHASSSLTSLVMGVQQAVNCLTALFVHSVLLEMIEVRSCTLLGGLIMSVGMMLGMFADSVLFLILTLGVLVGIGNAFTYGPGIILLGQYFYRRRALANSLASMGSSVGSMTLPVLATYLAVHYGLRGALLLYGAVTFHICVFASLYRPFPASGSPAGSPDAPASSDPEDDEEIVEVLSKEQPMTSEELVGRDSRAESRAHSVNVVTLREISAERHNSAHCLSSLSKLDRGDSGRKFYIREQCAEYPIGHDLDAKRLLLKNNREDSKVFASTGDMLFRSVELYEDRKRSLSVADLRNRPASAYELDQPLGSLLRIVVENVALRLSHPHLLLKLPAANQPRQRQKVMTSDSNDVTRYDSEVSPDDVDDATCRKLCERVSCDGQLLRKPQFWLVQCYVCVGIMGATGAGAYLPALMQEKGLGKDDRAFTLTVWGACNLAGRFVCGVVADRKLLRPSNVSALAFSGIGTLFMTVSFLPHSVAAWTVFSAVAGVLEGAYFSMLPDIIIGFVTLRYFSRTFGFAMLSQGAFSAVLFPVLGGLKDVTGSYHATFYLLGACAFMATFLLLLVPVMRNCHSCRSRNSVQ